MVIVMDYVKLELLFMMNKTEWQQTAASEGGKLTMLTAENAGII